MGAERLRKIQWGQESTAGTAVASTAIWRGKGVIVPDDQIELIDEQLGIHFPSDRSGKPRLGAMVRLDPVVATFEHIGYLLSASIKNVVSGSADGSGSSGYTYAYVYDSSTAANTIKYYTIEGVTERQTKEMEYSYIEELVIEGQAAGYYTVSATWRGRQWTNVTKTSLSTVIAADNMYFGNSSLYIDAGGGTIGSTAVTGTLLGYKLTLRPGWIPVYTGDNLYFDHTAFVGASGTLELKFEDDSNAGTEEAAWSAQTTRLIRNDIVGPAYGTAGSGTLFSGTKGMRIDCAGKYTSFSSVEAEDGNDIVTATLELSHNTTDDLFLAITTANELSSLA